MASEVDEVNVAAADDMHESCVAPDMAEVAERRHLGVPLRAGDRVRFEVVKAGGVGDDGPARREPWPHAWDDSVITDDDHLAERAREVIRAEFESR